MRPRYISDIPAGAVAREVSAYRAEGNAIHLREVEYRTGGGAVGKRWYGADGTLVKEIALHDGRRHGRSYEFRDSGAVSCVERYADGLLHGTSYQWDEQGRLLGRYVLRRGTGLDVWRHRHTSGRVYASEIRALRRGLLHGFEWWLYGPHLWSEAHYVDGKMHGIERHWTFIGKLDRGFPRFWIRAARVSKRTYLAAARADSSLPPYRERDDSGRRWLPARVREIVDRYAGPDGREGR